ncbi:MAG: putative heavy-metal-binding [Clostridia bacterium]|jgi:uncharacterized protein YbjQ (UPF0145 family)|nr:putative heavy-metal-binding [Clostridia bacterium]
MTGINEKDDSVSLFSQRASALGANAVVGIDLDYEMIDVDSRMMMVTALGTMGRSLLTLCESSAKHYRRGL